MPKLEIIKFGDKDGVGSIVKSVSFFGKITTWTLLKDESGIFCKWTERETGRSVFRYYCAIEYFYKAQYNTREK